MGFTIQTGNFNQTRMIIEMAPLGAIFFVGFSIFDKQFLVKK